MFSVIFAINIDSVSEELKTAAVDLPLPFNSENLIGGCWRVKFIVNVSEIVKYKTHVQKCLCL